MRGRWSYSAMRILEKFKPPDDLSKYILDLNQKCEVEEHVRPVPPMRCAPRSEPTCVQWSCAVITSYHPRCTMCRLACVGLVAARELVHMGLICCAIRTHTHLTRSSEPCDTGATGGAFSDQEAVEQGLRGGVQAGYALGAGEWASLQLLCVCSTLRVMWLRPATMQSTVLTTREYPSLTGLGGSRRRTC